MKGLLNRLKVPSAWLGLVLVVSLLAGCGFNPSLHLNLQETPLDKDAAFAYLEARTKWLNGDQAGALKAYQTALDHDPTSVYLHLETAKLLWSLGKVHAALLQAGMARNLAPDNPKIYELLGNLYYDGKQWKAAVASFEKVLELDPEKVKPYLFLSSLYADQKNYNRAVTILKRLLKRKPNSIMGNFYLGRINLEIGLTYEAEKYLLKVVSLKPTFIPALEALGILYTNQKKYDQAAARYQRILRIDPHNDKAKWDLSQIYIRQRKMGEALRLLKNLRAGQEGTSTMKVDIKIGLIYFDQKKYDEAIRVFSRLLKNYPGNNRIAYYLGTAYGEKGEVEKAVTVFSKIDAKSPLYSRAIIQQSHLLREAHREKEAIQLLRKALKKAPNIPVSYLALSTLLRTENKFAEAKSIIDKALALFPKNGDVYFEAGVVYDRLKDKKTCIKWMKKAIENNPKDASALNYLGYTYAEKGVNLDEAERLITRALKLRPKDGYIMDSMGWVYYQKGNYKKAAEFLERAIITSKKDAVIFEHLGDVYVKLLQFKKALGAYRESLKRTKKKDVIKRLHEKIGRVLKKIKD